MYIIITYDVNVSRVNEVKKFLRKYLTWIQNSVFEGEVSKATLEEIKGGIKDIINKEEDMVVIYRVRDKKLVKKEIFGVEKGLIDTTII